MTTKTTKIILFAVLVTVLLIPAGIGSVAAKQDKDAEIRSLFADIDKDVKSYVDSDMKDPLAKTAELKAKYADELDKIVSLVAEKVNVKLSTDDSNDLKDLIVREHMSEINRQKIVAAIPNDATTETIEVGKLSTQGYFELPKAYATGNPYPIHTWKQVSVDITGGIGSDSAGNAYNINGVNQFTSLTTSYTSSQVTYTLTFADEDAPSPAADAFWDAWRLLTYGRTTDIESFTVTSSGVNFSNIWANGKTFAEVVGQHGNIVRPYYSGVVIYISDVWNHAMDTASTNPGMSITTWTT